MQVCTTNDFVFEVMVWNVSALDVFDVWCGISVCDGAQVAYGELWHGSCKLEVLGLFVLRGSIAVAQCSKYMDGCCTHCATDDFV